MIRIEGVIMTKNQRQKLIIERQANEIANLKDQMASYKRLYDEKIEEILHLSEKLTVIQNFTETAREAVKDREIDVTVVVDHLSDYRSVIRQVLKTLMSPPDSGDLIMPTGITYFLTGRHLEAKANEVAKCVEWLNKYQWGD